MLQFTTNYLMPAFAFPCIFSIQRHSYGGVGSLDKLGTVAYPKNSIVLWRGVFDVEEYFEHAAA